MVMFCGEVEVVRAGNPHLLKSWGGDVLWRSGSRARKPRNECVPCNTRKSPRVRILSDPRTCEGLASHLIAPGIQALFCWNMQKPRKGPGIQRSLRLPKTGKRKVEPCVFLRSRTQKRKLLDMWFARFQAFRSTERKVPQVICEVFESSKTRERHCKKLSNPRGSPDILCSDVPRDGCTTSSTSSMYYKKTPHDVRRAGKF